MKPATLILADGSQLVYQLEHRARRTIGLKITAQGLVVHAPLRISPGELNRVLAEKSSWIINKLAQREARAPAPMQWENGAEILYLGQPLYLEINPQSGNKKPEQIQDTLLVNATTANLTETKVKRWLQAQALADFARRLQLFAAKLGVATPPLGLSNARSRWGSCSSRGDVRLNWRLIQAPPHIINYVVCHELAHLKHMNHSAAFWAQVAKLYPDYKLAEKDLKALSPLLHRI